LGVLSYKMSSIILNSFYRALMKIDEYTGIKTMTVKDLAVMLMDELYPEDGHISLEDDFRGNFRLRMTDEFLARVREESLKGKDMNTIVEEAMVQGAPEPEKAVEVEIPVAEPEPVPEPVKVVTVQPKKEAKPKAPKAPPMTEEEKAAKAAADKAAKEAKAAEAKAAKEAEKAAKAAEAKAAKEAEKAAKAAEPKPVKPKFVGNIEKLNPTQTKTWKKTAEDAKVTLTGDHLKQFLAHLNALDNKVYHTKKLEVHMVDFFAPKVEEPKTEDEAMWVVDYKGKEYGVNDKGEVYEDIVLESGEKIGKKVGMVGMAYFDELEQPTDE